MSRPASRGISAFVLIVLGQFFSLIGSSLTGFALAVWVYQTTGSVTGLALISLCSVLPVIVLSPVAGALVDRWDRRWTMIFSDSGAGLATLLLALLLFLDQLQIWHIYALVAFSSACSAFQRPAYAASIPLLVPKEQLGRANGLVQAGQAVGQVISPVLAGSLILAIGLYGIILIDCVSFLFAVLMLLLVRIPRPEASAENNAARQTLRQDMAYGWNYIATRSGLLALVLVSAAANFLVAMVSVLVMPLVLSVGSAAALGTVLSMGGVGMLAGVATMSIWGGPKRRMHGVLGFMLLGGICVMLAGMWPSLVLFAAAAFGFFFGVPISNGCSQAIYQVKVEPGVQGRVFAINSMMAAIVTPLAFLVVGPFADQVFTPLLLDGGPLAGSVGQIIGTGPGRGIGLLFIVAGLLMIALVGLGYLYPRLRLVEDELPDMLADAEPETTDASRNSNARQVIPAEIP
jgi:uncharacterized membrane protein YiaA